MDCFRTATTHSSVCLFLMQRSIVRCHTVVHLFGKPRGFNGAGNRTEGIERVLDVDAMQLEKEPLDGFVHRPLIPNARIVLDGQQELDLRGRLVAVDAPILLGRGTQQTPPTWLRCRWPRPGARHPQPGWGPASCSKRSSAACSTNCCCREHLLLLLLLLLSCSLGAAPADEEDSASDFRDGKPKSSSSVMAASSFPPRLPSRNSWRYSGVLFLPMMASAMADIVVWVEQRDCRVQPNIVCCAVVEA